MYYIFNNFLFIYSLLIHEENTKEITVANESIFYHDSSHAINLPLLTNPGICDSLEMVHVCLFIYMFFQVNITYIFPVLVFLYHLRSVSAAILSIL